MALIYITLQQEINNIFTSANSVYKNCDEYMATRCSQAIHDYVIKGQVATVDGGTGSKGGVYVGVGVGTMNINTQLLANLFKTTFLSKSSNYELARRIADNIQTVFTLPNTISTNSSGMSTLPPPSSVVYPDFCTGKGTFSGVNTVIFTKLIACFNSMNKMTKNGNMYFAQEWAKSIDEYLKMGQISVTLQAPIVGTGTGKIA